MINKVFFLLTGSSIIIIDLFDYLLCEQRLPTIGTVSFPDGDIISSFPPAGLFVFSRLVSLPDTTSFPEGSHRFSTRVVVEHYSSTVKTELIGKGARTCRISPLD